MKLVAIFALFLGTAAALSKESSGSITATSLQADLNVTKSCKKGKISTEECDSYCMDQIAQIKQDLVPKSAGLLQEKFHATKSKRCVTKKQCQYYCDNQIAQIKEALAPTPSIKEAEEKKNVEMCRELWEAKEKACAESRADEWNKESYYTCTDLGTQLNATCYNEEPAPTMSAKAPAPTPKAPAPTPKAPAPDTTKTKTKTKTTEQDELPEEETNWYFSERAGGELQEEELPEGTKVGKGTKFPTPSPTLPTASPTPSPTSSPTSPTTMAPTTCGCDVEYYPGLQSIAQNTCGRLKQTYGGQHGCDGAPRPIYGTVTYNDPVFGPQTTQGITGYDPDRLFWEGASIFAKDFKAHCPVTCGLKPACPDC